MELPLLTMHQRRIGRRSAARTLLLVLVTFVFICLMLAGYQNPRGWGETSAMIGILILYFYLLYIVADHACSFAWNSVGSQPEWHFATQSTHRMLLGGFTGILMTAATPAACLAVVEIFAEFAALREGMWFMANLTQRLLMVPVYALFCICLATALRRLPGVRFLPGVLAMLGVAASAWTAIYVYDYTFRNRSDITHTLMLASLILLIVFQLALVLLAERERPSLLLLIAVLVWLALPFGVGTSAALHYFHVGDYFYEISHDLNQLLYGHFALFMPSMTTLTNSTWAAWLVGGLTDNAGFMHLSQPAYAAVCFALVYLVVSFISWYVAALRCLDAARNPAMAWIGGRRIQRS